MINTDALLAFIEAPMERHRQAMMHHFGNWSAMVEAGDKLLAGEHVNHEDYPAVFHAEIKMMKLIMKYTTESRWDWSNPEIQKSFQETASSEMYKINAAAELRNKYPSITIHDAIWDVREKPPATILEKLNRPVLLFERWCIGYGGYNSIHNIAPAADILLMVESLSLSGIKMATDILFGRIGLQFYALSEARELLGQYFPFIHVCDEQTAAAINLPTVSIILAVKQYSE